MAKEAEIKRYIKENVSDDATVAALRARYDTVELKKETAFDAYFGLTGFPEGSSLRLRDEGNKLEVTLKVDPLFTGEGIISRKEFNKPEDVCQELHIPWQGEFKLLVSELLCKYGLNFIARQERTKAQVKAVNISLDTVYYHYVTSTNIPPVHSAAGKIFHVARIYEAETNDHLTEIANSITSCLSNIGLLGNICYRTKEQIGRDALFKSLQGTSPIR